MEVDQGIVGVARALTPVVLNRQKFPPHISVIRKEIPTDMTLWGLGDGEAVCFDYSPMIYNDEKYYWVNVVAPGLRQLRIGLGLPLSSIKSRPPDGADRFHITIGNVKGL